MLTNTDAILWYRVGVFGEAGYAVPNWSNDVGSVNPTILDLVNLIGRNLFTIMHHEDVDMRTPPSINTLKRVHKLYMRSKQILASRAVPHNVDQMETIHSRPSGEVFRVYPVPFFKVRNPFMRRWAEWMLMCLCECMQDTENRKELEITVNFAGRIGQYPTRVYRNMAVELFGKTAEAVRVPTFELTDADFAAFDPTKFFTSTELVDTVPRLDRVMTEDRLELLAEGIPVTELPQLGPWPQNLTDWYAETRGDATVTPSSVTPSAAAGGEGAAIAMPAAPAP